MDEFQSINSVNFSFCAWNVASNKIPLIMLNVCKPCKNDYLVPTKLVCKNPLNVFVATSTTSLIMSIEKWKQIEEKIGRVGGLGYFSWTLESPNNIVGTCRFHYRINL